jgi:hypothetical protein
LSLRWRANALRFWHILLYSIFVDWVLKNAEKKQVA